MPRARRAGAGGFLAGACVALALWTVPAPGVSPAQAPRERPTGGVVEQSFPPGGPPRTAWRVRWVRRGAALSLRGAWYRAAPEAPWRRVLWDLRLAELFTPDHRGEPRRYELAAARPLPVADGELAPGGRRPERAVALEVRDRGLVERGEGTARRGWELVLRGTFATATCRHPVEYALRDDGGVAVRLGTAAGESATEDAHLHDAWWRLDVDLDGPAGDGVLLERHVEPEESGKALDLAAEFNASREGGVERRPGRFHRLWLYDRAASPPGGEVGGRYELRLGAPIAARHPEPFAAHDVWVVRHHPGQTDLRRLADYAADRETITGKDVVVWLVTPSHHRPAGGGESVEWVGFELLRRGGWGS